MAELVSAQRTATKENVQRKQARTDGERDDSENEESEEESVDDDADDVPYNPKNLPLGWDGKVSIRLKTFFLFFINVFKILFVDYDAIISLYFLIYSFSLVFYLLIRLIPLYVLYSTYFYIYFLLNFYF